MSELWCVFYQTMNTWMVQRTIQFFGSWSTLFFFFLSFSVSVFFFFLPLCCVLDQFTNWSFINSITSCIVLSWGFHRCCPRTDIDLTMSRRINYRRVSANLIIVSTIIVIIITIIGTLTWSSCVVTNNSLTRKNYRNQSTTNNEWNMCWNSYHNNIGFFK